MLSSRILRPTAKTGGRSIRHKIHRRTHGRFSGHYGRPRAAREEEKGPPLSIIKIYWSEAETGDAAADIVEHLQTLDLPIPMPVGTILSPTGRVLGIFQEYLAGLLKLSKIVEDLDPSRPEIENEEWDPLIAETVAALAKHDPLASDVLYELLVKTTVFDIGPRGDEGKFSEETLLEFLGSSRDWQSVGFAHYDDDEKKFGLVIELKSGLKTRSSGHNREIESLAIFRVAFCQISKIRTSFLQICTRRKLFFDSLPCRFQHHVPRLEDNKTMSEPC